MFAVWAARRETDPERVRDVHRALLASRTWGLEHLDLLSADAARTMGLSAEQCREYLSGLNYALSYQHLEGLTSFLRRLAQRGLVTPGTLAFLAVA